jgi:hypothetical protein
MYPYGPNSACRKDVPYPVISHESVPSLIDNLVTSLYGTITKSVSNGRVVWNIPCDPNNTAEVPWLPRNTGEGLLCYILRVFQSSETVEVDLASPQTLSNKTLDSSCSLLGNASTATTATSANTLTPGRKITIAGDTVASSVLFDGSADVTLTTHLSDGSVTTGKIYNGTIMDVDINASASIANSKLAGTPTSANTASTIVLRDASGNFSAGTITASLSGTASSSGTATNLAGGTTGAVVYQSASATTAFLSAGTATQALIGGTSPAWSTSTSDVKLKNTAKAWYRGTISGGTLTQAAAYGCSVSRTGTGAFSVTLSNEADANYVVLFGLSYSTSMVSYTYSISSSTAFTFTTYVLSVSGSTLNQTATDLSSINFVVFGN